MNTAIVSSIGNPFILRYWLETYKAWRDEVDKVFIVISWWKNPELAQYVRDMFKEYPEIEMVESNKGCPYDIEDVARKTTGNIALLHDDTVIEQKGVMGKYFALAGLGNVVVHPGGSYSPINLIKEVLTSSFPDQMPLKVNEQEFYSFVFNFLFVSSETLQKTSGSFTSLHVKKGEFIPVVDSIATEDMGSDVGFILELELLKNRILIIGVEQDGWHHIEGMAYFFDELSDIDKRFVDKSFLATPAVSRAMLKRLSWLLWFMSTDTFEHIKSHRKQTIKNVQKLLNYL